MSSGSAANSSKKRKNRWGAPPPRSDQRTEKGPPSSSHHIIPKDNVQEVSEEDVIAALIASASKKEEQKQPKRDYKYGNNKNNNSNINHAQSSRNNRTSSGNGGTSNNSNRWGSNKSQSGSGVDGHYGPKGSSSEPNTTAAANNDNDNPAPPEAPKEKANFGLSGALAKDSQTGNTYKGVLLKFSEPQEARVPKTRWRFYVFKKKQQSQPSSNNDPKEGEELLEVLHISQQSAYLFGKDDKICDVVLHHSSISKQHCVLQYRALPDRNSGKLLCKPYLMDLDSTNGTFVNGERLDGARYYELRKRDVVTLGGSTREYVLLTENTTG